MFLHLLGFSKYTVIIYTTTRFVLLIETITAKWWQCFLWMKFRHPLSYNVLNRLKTTLNSRKSGLNLLSSTPRPCAVDQLRYLSLQTPTDSSCTLWLHVKYTYIINVYKLFTNQLYFWGLFFEKALLNDALLISFLVI
jgi:hypothetical protein